MDKYINSWQNGCCEDQSDFIYTIFNEILTINTELDLEFYNN